LLRDRTLDPQAQGAALLANGPLNRHGNQVQIEQTIQPIGRDLVAVAVGAIRASRPAAIPHARRRVASIERRRQPPPLLFERHAPMPAGAGGLDLHDLGRQHERLDLRVTHAMRPVPDPVGFRVDGQLALAVIPCTQLALADDEGGGAALVNRPVHAGVQADDPPLEAAGDAPVVGRRVPDHHGARAQPTQDASGDLALYERMTAHRAAVPERAIGNERQAVQRLGECLTDTTDRRLIALRESRRLGNDGAEIVRIAELAAGSQGMPAFRHPPDVALCRDVDLFEREPIEARREAGVDEQHVVDHDGHRQSQQPAAVFAVGRERSAALVIARWQARRRAGAKLRVIALADVAQVARQVHALVVAQHHVHRAAGRRGLGCEAHHEVHDLAAVVAAIQQVAD